MSVPTLAGTTQYSCFVLDAASSGRWDGCQTACKPGSVRPCTAGPGRPFLWDAHRCAPHATNPGYGAGTPLRHAHGIPCAPPVPPIRSCSRWGLPCRPCCQGRGALLPHRFTLAGRLQSGPAVCFLWHCPWGRPRRPLTGTVFPWSPDFPPPGPEPEGCEQGSGRPAVWPALHARARPRCQAMTSRTARNRAHVGTSS